MNIKALTSVLLIATLSSLSACDINQTEEGELPDVDVSVEEGNMPEYDVDTADVSVGTKEVEVEVPDVDVDVDSETKTVDVPDVDIDMPDDEEEPAE